MDRAWWRWRGRWRKFAHRSVRRRFEGMDLFQGEAERIVKVRWMGGLGELTEADRWSHIEYFPEINDVCDKCA